MSKVTIQDATKIAKEFNKYFADNGYSHEVFNPTDLQSSLELKSHAEKTKYAAGRTMYGLSVWIEKKLRDLRWNVFTPTPGNGTVEHYPDEIAAEVKTITDKLKGIIASNYSNRFEDFAEDKWFE
jgi:hypothetical protein